MYKLNIDHLNFKTPTDLALALADRVAAELSVSILERKRAILAVSGGKTPELFFHYLSKADIDWENIIITLVDERLVPAHHECSNEYVVRRYLLQNFAAKARFVGLYQKAITAELTAFLAASRINALPKPFDVIVLGMGIDGHTASFFPDADRLKQALDLQTQALVLPLHAKSALEPRLTLTLPVIMQSRCIILHFEGFQKRDCFEKVCQDGPEMEMPVRAVLRNAHHLIQVYWSPEENEITEAEHEKSRIDTQAL
ncbi:6-phosphogluconolactonase [Bartonella quintana]|uniref:6-phosphogluconolactonase n=3 Tax=Bartonella quintana TaxID=803 RepID=A0A0H3LTJ2_BARQU|nr:6-phosphogluconolactonase [Bartonella quintana]ETS13390.1 6-phosphogluconolactonase [Bartonella quintana BQ2-D70]ETS13952.1 6-phosphogluconolactonase [Bartonella quintana JK 73rel]ETS15639.1 6-phosphogluconolactonase [Bartonella quintana JK 73]ETS17643.1 6-phosphogluconolactonase [Bartonella quintana JK 7]ETS18472.1 6-phosphogluconolactonase [Bartonella quintana JK 12]